MHYKVIYRENTLRTFLRLFSQACATIDKNLDTIEWYDGLDAKEETEEILGMAFIAAQTYITGIVSDIREVNKKNKNHTRLKLISCCAPYVEDSITNIQLIDAIANYYKHNDEWSNWEINHNNKHTIKVLITCGITKNTEFPCYEAATILWPEDKMNELTHLFNILMAWREKILKI